VSNILALPLAFVSIETANNQDWIESFKYVVDDGSGIVDGMPQLDLRGIAFEMELRRSRDDHEVLIHATTDNHQLAIGAFPNYGFLLLDVSVDEMKMITAGNYIADIVARNGEYQRKAMELTVVITEGVTR
jgi:hypothetical protein